MVAPLLADLGCFRVHSYVVVQGILPRKSTMSSRYHFVSLYSAIRLFFNPSHCLRRSDEISKSSDEVFIQLLRFL
ncbi:hypothetical protein BJX96DRAFT_157127 [Aspergillus floccosus]